MVSANAQILNPARAYVYIAPVGTAAPTTSVSALAVAWVPVGLTTPDSLQFSTEPQFAEVQSHQSDYPTRRMQTSDSASISVDLQQWNGANLVSAYGGGAVTEPNPTTSPGEFKFTPPALGTRPERSCLIEVIDGSKHYRWVYPRTLQIEGVSTQFQRGQEARLPLRLAVLGDDLGNPWYLLTDDPAFDPTP